MVSHILDQTCSHGGLRVPNVAGKQVSKCKCFSNLFVMFANVLLAIANHMHQLNQRWTDYSVTTCKSHREGFPGGAVVKNLPANAGDTGSIPGPGRSHMPRSN